MDTTTRAQLEGLLASCCLSEADMDLRTLTQLFLTQMRIALYGGKSSIPMLPTFLKPFGELPDGQPVAVFDGQILCGTDELTPEGDGFVYLDSGHNRFYTEHIMDNLYYYSASF